MRRGMAKAIPVLGLLAGAAAAVLLFAGTDPPQDRTITVFARQYAYEPSVIRANRGDTLHVKLVSLDVTHGFYLEGHDVDAAVLPQQAKILVRRPSQGDAETEQDEIVVRTDRPGKYRYRCSHTCGALHPFMAGELIVAPNHLLHAGIGASAGLLLGFAAFVSRRPRAKPEASREA